ncbi:MAG: threonine ammonia-lyase [Halobacteriaceae archaeon]
MVELDDILAAQNELADIARRTPIDYSHTFSDMTGAEVHLKLEMFQRTGSFKIRGATNRIRSLTDEEKENGVVTASAGNHAQGVALAASRSGVDAKVVMPESAAVSKINATQSYGAEVILYGDDYNEAQSKAHQIESEENRTYVHAFNDEKVIAGQGTIGLEIIEDISDVDTVVVPIGGGGLISGVATAIKAKNPETRVIGVQAAGAASVATSLEKGEIYQIDEVNTIADGIATRKIEPLTFEIIKDQVDEVVTVSDQEIAIAVMLLLERGKTLVEGAGAVPLAALLNERFEFTDGEVIVPVLSGGNIDMNQLTTVLMRGLIEAGRYLKICTELPDRPGSLDRLLDIIAEQRANIYAIQHDRTSRDTAVNAAEVEIELETRGQEHVNTLLNELKSAGYDVEVLS